MTLLNNRALRLVSFLLTAFAFLVLHSHPVQSAQQLGEENIPYVIGTPAITSPVPGSTLSGTVETFHWTANGLGVSEWALQVGSSTGGSDIYDSGSLGIALSQIVAGLPLDGSTVYVRLLYRVGLIWDHQDFMYLAGTATAPPEIITPVPGSTLPAGTETFTWTANGTSVSQWMLTVGSTVAGFDIYSSGSLPAAATSHVASGLPADGSAVYVRLWFMVDGAWDNQDFTYTAVNIPTPEITTPAPGSVLSGPNETFAWITNGASVTNWRLIVGSSVGAWDIYASALLPGATTSEVVTGLPTDGSMLYVRLWFKQDGSWTNVDYTYTAAPPVGVPAITTPVPGSVLSGPTETFSWITNGAAVTNWWMLVGSSTGGWDIHVSPVLAGATTSHVVNGLPMDGRDVYVRLYFQVGGTWSFGDFTYTAATAIGTLPEITSPVPGSILPPWNETFTWTANDTPVVEWLLTLGSYPGGFDIYSSGRLPAATTSHDVSGLPLDGRTVYVRLWYRVDSTWTFVDYTFIASTGGEL